eukprot:GCRY01003622.1.p1 GENE.GCRY01003622.1~~GCRY01003622.1.p1  ORF type:complete len:417 (+),score=63.57 GCRY01003622.1:345-1595(+)
MSSRRFNEMPQIAPEQLNLIQQIFNFFLSFDKLNASFQSKQKSGSKRQQKDLSFLTLHKINRRSRSQSLSSTSSLEGLTTSSLLNSNSPSTASIFSPNLFRGSLNSASNSTPGLSYESSPLGYAIQEDEVPHHSDKKLMNSVIYESRHFPSGRTVHGLQPLPVVLISSHCLRAVYSHVGFKAKPRFIQDALWEVDDDNDGSLSWPEFQQMYIRGLTDRGYAEPAKIFSLALFLFLSGGDTFILNVADVLAHCEVDPVYRSLVPARVQRKLVHFLNNVDPLGTLPTAQTPITFTDFLTLAFEGLCISTETYLDSPSLPLAFATTRLGVGYKTSSFHSSTSSLASPQTLRSKAPDARSASSLPPSISVHPSSPSHIHTKSSPDKFSSREASKHKLKPKTAGKSPVKHRLLYPKLNSSI